MVIPTIPSVISKIRRRRAKDTLSPKAQLEQFGFASTPKKPTGGGSAQPEAKIGKAIPTPKPKPPKPKPSKPQFFPTTGRDSRPARTPEEEEEERRRKGLKEPKPAPKDLTKTPEVFRDVRTGQLSGIEAGGKTFFGLNPADVRKIMEGDLKRLQELQAFGLTPEESQRQVLKERIMENPEEFGLTPAEAQEITTEELAPPTQPPVTAQARVEVKPLSNFQKTMNLVFGNVLEIDPFTGEQRIDPATGQPVQFIEGVAPIGGAGGFWKVGGKVVTNPRVAMVVGKGIQMVKRVGGFVKNNKLLTGFLGVGGALITKELLEGKIDDRQQALNTAGQEASTIVGDIKTGHIDPREGLHELNRLYNFILAQEILAQEAKISSNIARFSGKMLDFDADVKDALDTIIEGRGDILEFRATGIAPEITPFEINLLLRELEEEGIIEKVKFAPFRSEVEKETP